MMTGPSRKETWLPLLANHIAQHGLSGASLRPLAQAAGTSDRMLLYHFGSKDRLMADLLAYLSAQFITLLDASAGGQRAASRHDCFVTLAGFMRQPMMRPMLRVWGEILVGAEGGNEAYRTAAHAIIGRLEAWIREHLPIDELAPEAAAAQILALVEGVGVLDMSGRSDIADRALAGPLR